MWYAKLAPGQSKYPWGNPYFTSRIWICLKFFIFTDYISVSSLWWSRSLVPQHWPEPCWWWRRAARHWRRVPGGPPESGWPSAPSDPACEPADAHCSQMAADRGQQEKWVIINIQCSTFGKASLSSLIFLFEFDLWFDWGSVFTNLMSVR